MKTQYKYIYFVNVPSKAMTKTSVWYCHSAEGGAILGQVRWHAPWRQYCFFINAAIFNKGCLEDVCDFIEQLKTERAESRARGTA